MRIAILNWSRRMAGGVEGYLGAVAPELTAAGHDVAFFYETEAPRDRPLIPWPVHAPLWSAKEMGTSAALAALGGWRPDVLYAHAVRNQRLEHQLLQIAPAVFFAHQYHGTCVSGLKTWSFPQARPCHRRFGPACLAHYYPHRCGGLSPVTMIRLYWMQARRLAVLREYRLIVTHSEHMRLEYLRHGFAADRVRKIPYLIRATAIEPRPAEREPDGPYRLLFVGRMERLKGGRVLLRALPEARTALGRPISLTFVGDGRLRATWESAAERARAQAPDLDVRFLAWASAAEVDRLYASADLLVMPSLWPEPFGQAGLEAGRFGVPSVGFAVGGIPEWLHDGVNGHLAPGDPPTPSGLAQAIVRCLRDPAAHARLARGAKEMSQRYRPQDHVPALVDLLEAARSA